MNAVDIATIVGAIASVIAIPVSVIIYRRSQSHNVATETDGRGGQGGGGKIIDGNGIIIGGRGGGGGPAGAGRGGDGGSGTIVGGSGIIIGGDGGEAGQFGRGGLGAMSPFERLGLGDVTLPDGRKLSEFGRGGDGGAPPIVHGGRSYVLAQLIRHLAPEQIREIDSTKPGSSQEWWDRAVRRWPDTIAEIINSAQAID